MSEDWGGIHDPLGAKNSPDNLFRAEEEQLSRNATMQFYYCYFD